ncbi:MAG: metallophosphoesterase [Phycisphaerae bacterium]|nr:metallophosphoesterase [Phycisphaerae bacterium]
MLRLLVVGDLHANLSAIQQIVRAAATAPSDMTPDAVILTGDFAAHDARLPAAVASRIQRGVVRATESLWCGLQVPILCVPGNHDRPDLWGVGGCLQSIDTLGGRQPAMVKGYRVIGVGGSWRFGGLPYEWEDSEGFEKALEDRWPASDDVPEVLLFHAPPAEAGVDRVVSGECVGSRALRNIALRRRPRLVICGHIHEGIGPGVLGGEIPVFNAGLAGVPLIPPFMLRQRNTEKPRRLRVPGSFFSMHMIEESESQYDVVAMCNLGRGWIRQHLVFESRRGWRVE